MVEDNFATVGPRIMLFNTRKIVQTKGKEIILLAIEDITGWADELVIANQEKYNLSDELDTANEEKSKLADKLIIVKEEKDKRADELSIVNKEKEGLLLKLKLAASVFSHANEGIVITDATATITEVNDTFSRITGYTSEEVLGKNPRLLQPSRHSPEFYAEMWATLLTQGKWRGELWSCTVTTRMRVGAGLWHCSTYA